MLGWAYTQVGMDDKAQKLLEELEKLARQTYVPPNVFAVIYSGLKDNDRTFYWLEKAIEERDSISIRIDLSPAYDNIRSHPRYKALLRKMNLEP
jgi:hypothetical protein